MNTGDAIQIEVPDFDPDIDEALPTSTDQDTNDPVTQGSETHILKSAEKVIESRTPASPHQNIDIQEVDWPDTIPVEIPPQHDQQIEQNILTLPTHRNLGPPEIPQLKDNSEGEQYQDLETYLSHHNMFEASQHIRRDYRSRLLALDDDIYYQEIDRVYQTWKIFQKHQTIPDDIQDLHFHIDDFKNGIEKEFAFLRDTPSTGL